MKIQLEQLDLLRSWPEIRGREGYDRIRLLVLAGRHPVGQIQIRSRPTIPKEPLRRLIAGRTSHALSRAVISEGLKQGPEAIAQVRAFGQHNPGLGETGAWKKFAVTLCDPAGMPQPYRQWMERSSPPALTPPVTVVICTADRAEMLEDCLRAVKAIDYPQYAIAVVDNSRNPLPTRELCNRVGVGYLRAPIPGKSAAMNLAIRSLKAKWLALVDDDCLPDRNWLRELVRPISDTRCACVTGLTLPAEIDSDAQASFEEYGGFGRGFTPTIFGDWWFHQSRLRAPATWNIGGGGNSLVDREVLVQFGFDQDLGAGCKAGTGEDIDMFYQILRRKRTIHYNPSAMLRHRHRTTEQTLRQQLRGYSLGHTAYHWRCLWRYGDIRSLFYLIHYLPKSFWRRSRMIRSGKSTYPRDLLRMEIRAMAAGWLVYTAAKLQRLGRYALLRLMRREPPPTCGEVQWPGGDGNTHEQSFSTALRQPA